VDISTKVFKFGTSNFVSSQSYKIRLLSDSYYLLELIPNHLEVFKYSLDVLINKNGQLTKGDYYCGLWDGRMPKRFSGKMKIKYLKINTKFNVDEIVDYLNKFGVFKKITICTDERNENIEAEFKDFTLTLNTE
jgi:hypothetical protein